MDGDATAYEFAPISGKHAIEACTASIRMFQALDPASFGAILEQAAVIADSMNLPARQQIGQPQIVFGMGAPQGLPAVGGFATFQRYSPNGQAELELRCEPQSLTLVTRSYSKWDDLLDLLDQTLLKLLVRYIATFPAITGVLLQYDDRFNAPAGDRLVDELFRADSRWFPGQFALVQEAWHSHNGVFISRNDAERELVNVNITVSDAALLPSIEVRRSAALSISVSESFDIPGQSPLIVSQDEVGIKRIRDEFIRAHSRQREIFDEVITEKYLRLVGAIQD